VKSNLDVETISNVNIDMWNLFFDGSKYNEGAGVGCILKDPKGKKTLIAFGFEFQCTNNTVEYESLIQGLRKSMDLKVKLLKVLGDFEIVIRQVLNTMPFISSHLKHYQQEVWDIDNNIDDFNINPIPRSLNCDVDILVNVDSNLIPSKVIIPDTFFCGIVIHAFSARQYNKLESFLI
jgi:ribonuclease HI